MNIIEEIKEKTVQIHSDTLRVRQYLHAHPELSNKEVNTARFISEFLEKQNIPFEKNIAGNGIVALLKGKNPNKKVIAIRADMDALPIEENNDIPYQSVNKGVMHACGHDVHTTCLMMTAKLLKNMDFEGSIKLIFQPSEEEFSGGAIQMIQAGVLDNPKVEEIIALHVQPDIQIGKLGFRKGLYMASTDEIYIKIKGIGGHAALPELLKDPIKIGAESLLNVYEIIEKNKPEEYPTVLQFGNFIGEGKTNIVPDRVSLEGTLRTFNESWRKKAHQLIRSCFKENGEKYGIEIEVDIVHGYPCVYNNSELTDSLIKHAKAYLGDENIIELPLRKTAEDFAYFSHTIPSSLFRLGVGNVEKGIVHGLHTSRFNVDEEAMDIGIGFFIYHCMQRLKES